MKSIDRLRMYVDGHDKITGLTATCIGHLIDSIEEEVEREAAGACDESPRRFAERLEAAAAERADVTLFGVDYTPLELVKEHLANRCMTLPVDADGEPWHINDEFEVDEGIAHVNGIGDNRLYYIDNDGMQWTRADNKCHHHAPTVEDVLREYALKCEEAGNSGPEVKRLATEYAARLMLAGEDA